jgi:L-histidine N-alpha-methyltransferase
MSSIEEDVRRGLTISPKDIPPKWFYDDRGSELFDAITRLPEYYPTRREREILRNHAPDIVELSRADTLVELGSGTSEKTRILLDAMRASGRLRRFVPFDVSKQTLHDAAAAIEKEYPGIDVQPVVGDFTIDLETIPRRGRRLVAFLGGTIGNLLPDARRHFLRDVAGMLGPNDTLLIGTDLVKDAHRLVAAYDDAQGVTAEFNKNVLAVMNRELDASFELDAFEHVAMWDDEREWIEMRLRSTRPQTVELRAIDMEVEFAAGEEMRTEVSAKFRRERVENELRAAGMELVAWWTDAAGDFALSLARRVGNRWTRAD